MKYKYLLTLLVAGFLAVATGQNTYATTNTNMPAASVSIHSSLTIFAADVDCAILPDAICKASNQGPDDKGEGLEKSGIFMLLIFVLQLMTGLVGIAAVGALIYAGVLYSSAGGSKEQVVKSKKLITDTVIGIIAYALMFFALNWLIPGGVIG